MLPGVQLAWTRCSEYEFKLKIVQEQWLQIKYCVWLWNAAAFCKKFTKLYFEPKHLEKGFNMVEILGLFLQKK